jgi:hypothetical protein
MKKTRWKCDGICQKTTIKKPNKSNIWWYNHMQFCGGIFQEETKLNFFKFKNIKFQKNMITKEERNEFTKRFKKKISIIFQDSIENNNFIFPLKFVYDLKKYNKDNKNNLQIFSKVLSVSLILNYKLPSSQILKDYFIKKENLLYNIQDFQKTNDIKESNNINTLFLFMSSQ